MLFRSVFDVRGELGRIQVPTLVLVGRKDFVCSVRFANALHVGIPGSRLVVLEKSGHMSYVEEPDRFFRVVDDFLAGRPTTRETRP